MTLSKISKEPFLLTLLFVTGIIAIFVSLETRDYFNERSEVLQEKKIEARQIVDSAAFKIDSAMAELIPFVEGFKDSLANAHLNYSDLYVFLERQFQRHKDLLEIGFASKRLRRAPHYGIRGEVLGPFDVARSYDFTTHDWYTETEKHGKYWIDAYFGGATKTMVTGFASKFQLTDTINNRSYEAICRANVSLAYVNRLLLNQSFGKTGYSFLLSSKDQIIAHPRSELVVTERNLTFLEEQNEVPDSLRIQIQNESQEIISWKNPIDDRFHWTLSRKIPTTNWHLVAQFAQDEMIEDYTRRAQHKVGMLVTGWLSLGIFILLLIGHKSMQIIPYDQEWFISISTTILVIIGTGFLWWNIEGHNKPTENVVLVDEAGIAKVSKNLNNTNQQYLVDSITSLPTGVFIQSLEFTSSNNVTLTGYIWQKYTDKMMDEIEIGYVFPEAIQGSMTEKYRQKTGDYTLIGWYFESILRQPFDYKLYPFDPKKVWLRIWPNEYIKPVILIPDLAGYPYILPTKNPGVEQGSNFVLNGWSIMDSHFEYQTNKYNGNFGIDFKEGRPALPELYFTINLKRNFINAFITNLVPLIVVLVMLLATLLMVSKEDKTSDRFGSKPFGILGACSGLFFLVMISHIQLRQEFSVPDIMYLEYFYFVMYGAILMVSVISYLIVSKARLPFMQKNDGLNSKVLFLPTVTVTMYLITLYAFY